MLLFLIESLTGRKTHFYPGNFERNIYPALRVTRNLLIDYMYAQPIPHISWKQSKVLRVKSGIVILRFFISDLAAGAASVLIRAAVESVKLLLHSTDGVLADVSLQGQWNS